MARADQLARLLEQRHPHAQAGVALISVLLIVALLTALVYQLLGRHSLGVAQSQNSLGFDQALAYALGAEALARQALFEDFSTSGPGIDTLDEPWAQSIPPFELDEEGFLEIQARDLNRCFNLNALASDDNYDQHLPRLKTLLNNLGIPDPIADALRDWVDSDEAVEGFGTEEADYLLRVPAYRTPNAAIAHVSELRLIAGVEQEHLEALTDHICALPTTELQINVNTATLAVLAALAMDPNMDFSALQKVSDAIRSYSSVAEFTSEFPSFSRVGPVLDVNSTYFEVQVRAQVGDATAVLTSLLHRHPDTGVITLVSRDLGKDFRTLFVATKEDA